MNKRVILIITVLIVGILSGFGLYSLIKQFYQPENKLSQPYTYSQQNCSGLISEKLLFTDEQQDKANNFEQLYAVQVALINTKLDSLRGQLVLFLTMENEDVANINLITLEIGNQHTLLKRATVDYYLHLKTICNHSQRERLNGMFQELLSYPEYGNKQGRKKGNGFRWRHRRGQQ